MLFFLFCSPVLLLSLREYCQVISVDIDTFSKETLSSILFERSKISINYGVRRRDYNRYLDYFRMDSKNNYKQLVRKTAELSLLFDERTLCYFDLLNKIKNAISELDTLLNLQMKEGSEVIVRFVLTKIKTFIQETFREIQQQRITLHMEYLEILKKTIELFFSADSVDDHFKSLIYNCTNERNAIRNCTIKFDVKHEILLELLLGGLLV